MADAATSDFAIDKGYAFRVNSRIADGAANARVEVAVLEELPNMKLAWLVDTLRHLSRCS
jgi:hypothetical protein